MLNKIMNILFYIFLGIGILIGIIFAIAVIIICARMFMTEWKNTIMIIGSLILLVVMVFVIKKVRNEI